MQLPIIIGTEIDQGKNWPIYHKNEVCAKTNKIAQEVFKISGCNGECLRLVEVIDWPESESTFPSNDLELWVLGDKLIMN